VNLSFTPQVDIRRVERLALQGMVARDAAWYLYISQRRLDEILREK
jgi:hypothetical protein